HRDEQHAGSWKAVSLALSRISSPAWVTAASWWPWPSRVVASRCPANCSCPWRASWPSSTNLILSAPTAARPSSCGAPRAPARPGALWARPWCLALAYAGYKLGQHWGAVSGVLHKYDILVGIGILALVVLFLYRHLGRQKAVGRRRATGDRRQ